MEEEIIKCTCKLGIAKRNIKKGEPILIELGDGIAHSEDINFIEGIGIKEILTPCKIHGDYVENA